MQHLVIYYTKDSSDLALIPADAPTLTVGNDGMEVIVSDFSATRIREIAEENPDRLILDTDRAATAADVAAAIAWYDMERPPLPGEEPDIQDVLRLLGSDDEHEIEHIVEAELTRQDCLTWHNEAEATPNVERLIDIFGAFQIWGMPNPQQGEEPLRVVWPA